jgi:hypothetical protein
MGQARRRGSFETRLAQAVARNECLRGYITDKPKFQEYSKNNGIQRLATRLLACGLLATIIEKRPNTCELPKNLSP